MIQYPINIQPQNQAFDATAPNFVERFVFNGDYLSGLWTRVFDYDTGEIVREDWWRESNNAPIAYNGDEVYHEIGYHNLVNGGRYVFQMMLIQRTQDGYHPLCDMPVVGGKVELSADNTSILYISKGITSIYPWGKNGNTYTPNSISQGNYFNPMEIQIGSTKRTVVSYEDDYEVDGVAYGKLTLDGNITVNAGDYYRIYSNALITPQYFFKCNSTPIMDFPDVTIQNGKINVNWTYKQAEGIPMKYHTLRLLWSNDPNFAITGADSRIRVIAETNKMYSQKVYYNFDNPFYHDYDAVYPDTKDYYRVEFEGVTQDGMTFTAHEDIQVTPLDYRAHPLDRENLVDFYIVDDIESGGAAIYLRGYPKIFNGEYYLFRRPLRYNETTKQDEIVGDDELVGWTRLSEPDVGVLKGFDITNSEKGRYQYTLMLFSQDGEVIIPDMTVSYSNAEEENAEEIAEIMAEIEEKGININQTIYGNINTNNRQILEWTSSNLARFSYQYESWGYTADELRGTISTVMGASAEFDGVEIAFSPILQTEEGALLLDENTVTEYIWGLIDNAGNNWTKEQLLALDNVGLEFSGVRIRNLVADVGETAIATGEAMHYTGSYGALAMARRYGNFPTNKVECNGAAYYITALYESVGDNPSPIHTEDIPKRKVYRLGDTWRFSGEISNTTVTNNLDTMVHVGYGRYISTTSTEVNYESGTLSAMIGYVDCVNHKYIDDIVLVKAWRKFITQKVPFLLKSQKGDVWVVAITDNPTTEYDETVRSIPTTFSFSWAECDSIDNVFLKDRG